jgi:hypothetical protein
MSMPGSNFPSSAGNQNKNYQSSGAQPLPQPVNPQKKFPYLWACLGVFVLSAVCLLVVAGGAGLYYFYSSGVLPQMNVAPQITIPQPENNSYGTQAGFSEVQKVAAVPDGQFYADEKGVGLMVAPLEGKANQSVNLVSSQPGQDLEKTLQDSYTVESLAYSVTADGAGDTARKGTLAFPVQSPQDQLAVIIDQKYVGLLSIAPQDGKLTISPRVDLPGADPVYAPTGVEPEPTQYILVRPKNGAALPSKTLSSQPPAGGVLQSPKRDDLVSCGDWWHSYCWKNKEETVFIFFDKDTALSFPFIDMIDTSTKALAKYKSLGFTGAALSKDNPLYIVVGGDDAPKYSSKTGNLYVPLDILSKTDDPSVQYAISHELFHWTEDESYAMTLDALSGIDSWWLEVAAENAAYMVNPSYINENLKKYGRTATNNILGFQLEPFTWQRNEEARYIHGQNLLVSLCSGGAGCALSDTYMVAEINNAQNPFTDAAVKQRYQDNALDVARYLLGAAPQQSNNGVELPEATKTGKIYGDFIHGKKKGDGTEFQTSNYAPNYQKSAGGVVVTAKIPAGDVYPLRVSNGNNGPDEEATNQAGAPLYLLIDPNQDYLMKVGDNEPLDASGKGQLMVGPIHDKLGIDAVRLAAFARSNPAEFKAKVGIVDLSGDWFLEDIETTKRDFSCPDTSADDNAFADADPILNILSAYGVFSPDPTDPSGATLKWVQSQPVPDSEGVVFQGKVVVGSENIHLTYTIDIPQKTSSSLFFRQLAFTSPQDAEQTAPTPWALAALPGAALVALLPKKNRRQGLLLALLLLAFFLPLLATGCGLKGMYGKITGDYTFTKLEYPEKDFKYPPAANTFWTLSAGTGSLVLDLTSISNKDLFDPSKGTTQEHCVSTFNFKMNGAVQKDGIFTPADVNLGGN